MTYPTRSNHFQEGTLGIHSISSCLELYSFDVKTILHDLGLLLMQGVTHLAT